MNRHLFVNRYLVVNRYLIINRYRFVNGSLFVNRYFVNSYLIGSRYLLSVVISLSTGNTLSAGILFSAGFIVYKPFHCQCVSYYQQISPASILSSTIMSLEIWGCKEYMMARSEKERFLLVFELPFIHSIFIYKSEKEINVEYLHFLPFPILSPCFLQNHFCFKM